MVLTDPLYDVLRLAEEVRPAWGDLSAEIPAWHPRNEGDDAASDDADKGDTDAGAGDDRDAAEDDAGSDKADPLKQAVQQSRKHEREKKAALKREADLKARLDAIEASNLSDKEKEIKAAREEARNEALTEAGKERRADKIELAVTKIAVQKGVKVGEGDKAKTVTFADSDDVQMWLERQIAKGDIDGDELYADGKVNDSALTAALTELAQSKPGWLAGATPKAPGTPAGDPDVGKGKSGTAALDMNDLIRGRRG